MENHMFIFSDFCNKVNKEGVKRMKYHFRNTHRNVAPCVKVPEDFFFFLISKVKFIYKETPEKRLKVYKPMHGIQTYTPTTKKAKEKERDPKTNRPKKQP